MALRTTITPSRALRGLAASVIAGVAAHAFMERAFHVPPLLTITCVAALLVGAVFDTGFRRLMGVCAVLGALAFLRYDTVLSRHPAFTAALPGGTSAYAGTVVGEPSTGLARTSVTVDAIPAGGERPFRMRISSALPIEAADGDTLSWKCVADPVLPEGRFSYGDWLFARGYAATCAVRAPPRRTGTSAAGVTRRVFAVKDALRRRIRRLFPEPDASFLLGLLVGDRGGLPDDAKDAFRDTGTTHVLAVSGYNVTQITRLMLLLLAIAGVMRRRAAVATIVAVVAFTVIAGADASVVRAAIMGSLGLIAATVGRRYSGSNAVLVAGALMLAVNPLLLRHDIGFLLSFASLIGLQSLTSTFARRSGALPEAAGIRQAFAETLAATVATVPLIIYAFDSIAPVALPANAIILPFVPLATALGAGAVAVSVPWPPLGLPVALAATAVLRIIRGVIVLAAATVPPVAVSGGLWVLVVGYACIAVLWYALVHAPPVSLSHRRLPEGVIVEVHDAG